MDTPRSTSPSIAAAAPELDDHRLQPHSLPRNTVSSGQSPTSPHGGSFGPGDGHLRPDAAVLLNGRHGHSGSYEHAIEGETEGDEKHEGGYLKDGVARRASVAHSHRSDANPNRQYSGRRYSRTSVRSSIISSRSSSPPNSVDAFASPGQRQRKERSGTVTSHAPSDLGLALQRTHSRRQTFTEAEDEVHSSDEVSQAAEEDVCFPPPEEDRVRGGIDFEEMEDFLIEQREEKERRALERTMSRASAKERCGPEGFIFKASGPEGGIVDGLESASMNEKAGVGMGRETPMPAVNRYSFFSSEMDTTVHAPEIGDLLMEGETFHSLFRGGQSIWWLDCLNPTPEELSMLMKAFAIHPLTAEDIRVQETREKVELFRSYYFVCFRSFVQNKESEDYMEPINVYVIVFREGVLSFHFAAAPHSANVRRRIRQLRDYVALSSDWICYALIDDIVDSFAPVINEIEKDSDAVEDAVFVARPEDYSPMLKRIGDCRKKTMSSMRLLGGKADVIKGFAKRCNEQYQVTPRGEIGLYLGDIQDHIVTMMSNLSHFEKMLSRSHSNYLAALSVDSIMSNNRASEALGKITVIATILVPLNLICGLFGMNVPVPGRETDNLAWFFGIVGVIIVFSVSSMWVAKRMRII